MRPRISLALVIMLAVGCLMPSTALAKGASRLSITASSSYEHFDKKPTISGRLLSAGGRPLARATVKLYCGAKYVAAKKTDAKGRVSFKAALPGSLMSGEWRLVYSGSRTHRAVRSGTKVTRIHVHYSGPAGVVGAAEDDTGDTVDDGIGDTVDDGTGDTVDDGVADDGTESGLDDGSPYAAGMRASVVDDEEPADEGAVEDPDPEVVDVDPVADAGYPFVVNVLLDEGARYAIEVGEPARFIATDSAGRSVAEGDDFQELHEFAAPATDDYTFAFDTGLTLDELDELYVLIW